MLLTGAVTGLAMLSFPGTSPAHCAMLQAAFDISAENAGDGPPSGIVAARHASAELRAFAPRYRDAMGLTSREFADLEANQKSGAAKGFVPDCAWQRRAIASRDDPKGPAISLGTPIVSSDARLALVEVQRDYGLHGRGELCILRLAGGRWSGRCMALWSRR